jgi:hypothetical protein
MRLVSLPGASTVWVATAALLLLSLAAPAPSALAGPTPVGNQGLQGGWAVDPNGNTDFYHSLSTQFGAMHEAKAGWVRINLRLGDCYADWVIPGCDGRTAVQAYTVVVNAARNNSLKVLGLLSNETRHGGQDQWTVNNVENGGSTGDNPYIQGFAADAGYLAGRFNGTNGPLVDQWEVWNEPNAWESQSGTQYFGSSFVYPSNFAQLLRRSYQAIKQANPSAVVISGGLFGHDIGGASMTVIERGRTRQITKQGTFEPRNGRPGSSLSTQAATTCTTTVKSGADYLCATYQMGRDKAGWVVGASPFDHVGQHLYIDQGGLTSDQKVTSYLKDLRDAYVAVEGATTSKRTHMTEGGWSTQSVSAQTQARNLQTAYIAFKKTNYVQRAYWFNVQDIPEGGLYYGLLDGNGGKKAAFSAYQKYAAY